MTQEMNLGGGSGCAFQFVNPGDSVTGKIVEFSTVPQTHFDGPQKGEPRTFPDGKPMTMVQVDLQTVWRNSEGLKEPRPAGTDDGIRQVWLKANKSPDSTSTMQAVIAAAVAAVGKGAIAIGGTLTLIMTGEVKSHTGQLAKAYSARYAAPSVDLAPPGPTQAVATAAPAAVPSASTPAPPAAAGGADPLATLTPEQRAALGLPALEAAAPAWDADPRVAGLRAMGIADAQIRVALAI